MNIIFHVPYLDLKLDGLTIDLPDTDAMTGMGKSCAMNNRILI